MSAMHLLHTFAVITSMTLCMTSWVLGASKTCRINSTYKGLGVDLQASRDEWVDARQLNSSHVGGKDGLDTCSKWCCESDSCNVAIYMSKFTHKNDKNCLLIKCDPIDNCQWEKQDGFLVAVLHKNHQVDTVTRTAAKTRTTTTSSTTPTTLTNSTAKPLTATTPILTTHVTTDHQTSPSSTTPLASSTAQTTIHVAVVLTGKDKLGRIYAENGPKYSPTVQTVTPSTAPDQAVTTDNMSTTNELVATTQQSPADNSSHTVSGNLTTTFTSVSNTSSTNDTLMTSFANLGGQAFMTPTTVGLTLALAMGVVFTAGVLILITRRVCDSWQRRHYRKMDYLIDGMYN